MFFFLSSSFALYILLAISQTDIICLFVSTSTLTSAISLYKKGEQTGLIFSPINIFHYYFTWFITLYYKRKWQAVLSCLHSLPLFWKPSQMQWENQRGYFKKQTKYGICLFFFFGITSMHSIPLLSIRSLLFTSSSFPSLET